MERKIGKLLSRLRQRLWPSPGIEFLVGESGIPPTVEGNSILFSMKEAIFVQQLLHENDPGGTQTIRFDIWVRIPDDHCGFLSPYEPNWRGGRVIPLARHLAPGWSGELSLTCFNSHPEEAAGVPAGEAAFQLILTPTTGTVWASPKR